MSAAWKTFSAEQNDKRKNIRSLSMWGELKRNAKFLESYIFWAWVLISPFQSWFSFALNKRSYIFCIEWRKRKQCSNDGNQTMRIFCSGIWDFDKTMNFFDLIKKFYHVKLFLTSQFCSFLIERERERAKNSKIKRKESNRSY